MVPNKSGVRMIVGGLFVILTSVLSDEGSYFQERKTARFFVTTFSGLRMTIDGPDASN